MQISIINTIAQKINIPTTNIIDVVTDLKICGYLVVDEQKLRGMLNSTFHTPMVDKIINDLAVSGEE